MFDVSQEEITEGSIPWVLLSLATPIVVQQLVVVAQQLVDIFWVGQLNADAVASIGLVTPLIGLLSVGAFVAYVGGQVVAAQRVGADDEAGARQAVFHALLFVLGLTAVLAVLVYFLAPSIIGLFRPGTREADYAVAYVTTLSFGLIFAGMSDALEAGFVGWGDSRTSLMINMTTVAVNIVLDPFLVLGLFVPGFDGWGVRGAALATATAYFCGFTVAFLVAASGRRDFSLTRETVRFDPDLFREVLSVGVPKAGQEVGRQVARLIIVTVVSFTAGAAGMAAYTLGARIATVAFVPAAALGSAATSVVGQNLGAARPDRANRTTWIGIVTAVVGLTVVGILQALYPGTIAHLFVPDISGSALRHATSYLTILAFGYWALGAIYTVEAGFNGASRTKVSMVATLVQYWAVRVPFAVIGAYAFGLGVDAVFWAVTLSNIVAAAGLCAYYLHSTNEGMFEQAAKRVADRSGNAAD